MPNPKPGLDESHVYSREQYRAWYELQAGRFERVEGRIIAISPQRVVHARIKAAVFQALQRAVLASGLDCEALPDGVTVETEDSDFEPDAMVNCGPRVDGQAIAAPTPVIVVEVLSPGTQSVDTGVKLTGYFQVASIAHYLIVHPTRRVVIHHSRTADGIGTRIVAGGSIDFDPPGITVDLDAVYGSG